MQVGRKVFLKNNTDVSTRIFTIVGLNDKHQKVVEIESKLLVSNSGFYIKYNGRYYCLYEWDGPDARYAVLLYEPTEDMK